MSSPGQWVATCSTHVVLDGVPFKISDNFRTAPVVASSEGRLCLRSQSLCLQTQYLFEKEIECLRRYKDFIFARESAEESKRKEAEAAAASAAAAATASVSSVERGLGDADQGWAAAPVAGVADSGSGGAATGTGRWRSSPAPAVAQRPVARPTHPNMGHDLLVPKPVVPLKPKLSNGAGSVSAAASLGGLPAGKAAPLDLALFEQEEDVFDKMQLRTLNDFEELRSVLQPREATPVQAIDCLTAESDSGGCDNSPLHRGAVDVARGCKESSGWVADRAPDSAAGIAAAAGANSLEVALSLVTTDSSRVGAGGARSSAATVPSAAVAATEAGAGSSPSPLSAVGAEGMTATTTGVRVTITAAAPAASCASPAAASRAASPLESAAVAKPRPLTHRKVLPSLPPPKRFVSTDEGSEPRGAAAAASDVPTAVATSGSLTRAAVRPPPRPPPPAKPTVQQAERPANASLQKPPTLAPTPAALPGKPFSYVAGAGSPLQSLPSPRSGLGSNAWAVKNIVWPELLSSPEAATASVAAVARLSSAATPDSSFDSGPAHSINGQPGNQLAVSRPTVASPGAVTRRDPAANGGANDDNDGLASKLLAMGFPWRHVEAAVKEFGKDDKKVVEHLCILSDLVDKGYDWTIAQKAILSYPGQLAKVQEYLLSYRRLLEYGFEGQKIQQALMAHDANVEKALDVLAGTASS